MLLHRAPENTAPAAWTRSRPARSPVAARLDGKVVAADAGDIAADPSVEVPYVPAPGPDGVMPTDPEHGWLSFTVGKHKQAAPLDGVRLRGRAGLNEWYEQHVGRHVSLPTFDAVRDIAIRLLRHHGRATTND